MKPLRVFIKGGMQSNKSNIDTTTTQSIDSKFGSVILYKRRIDIVKKEKAKPNKYKEVLFIIVCILKVYQKKSQVLT